MFPDMGLWVYYREIYGGHGADCQTQKDILEASAYMSQTPSKEKESLCPTFYHFVAFGNILGYLRSI